MRLTLPKVGTWSPPGLPQLQSSKHLVWRCSLYRWKGLRVWMSKMASHGPFRHLQHKLWSKEGPRVKLAVWLPTTKSRESTRPDPGVCRRSATHHWKALEESYKFAWDLVLIWGLSQELWPPKVPGVQTGIVLGFLLGSPGNKSHLDAGAMEQRRECYMGEGGGFPWVWAVVSPVS
jgi:hypothetical protein